MDFPLTLVKDKQEEKVYHAPDLQGWLDAGWKLKDETPKKTSAKTKEDPIKGLDI